jgi:hypothetical protein
VDFPKTHFECQQNSGYSSKINFTVLQHRFASTTATFACLPTSTYHEIRR